MAVELVTVADAARQLAVHEDTVRRLIERGELRAVRLGRAVRIDAAELVAYVRRGRPVEEVRAITPGQLRALHAKGADGDRLMELERGTSKRLVLAAAGQQFGRQITSANELDETEASWVLDRLDEAIARAGEGR